MSSPLPDGSQPASPDVLEEELEEEILNMLETADGTREVAQGLDAEVADALEAELFGGGDDDAEEGVAPAVASPSPDLSETELFGEEVPVRKDPASKTQVDATCETDVPPPPPPFSATAAVNEGEATDASNAPDTAEAAFKEAQREDEEGAYDKNTSRYMKDDRGNLLHKWKLDYASRGGGGRAQCKDTDCLERHDQGGVRTIEKGCLRIARRIVIDQDRFGHGGEEAKSEVSLLWYHARCIFNMFLRARKTTRIIESEFDLEGFDTINLEDQEMLRKIIDNHASIKGVRFRTLDGTTSTPQKRGASGADGPGETGKKRRMMDPETRVLKKGDRVWTYFRCLPKDTGAGVPPGAAGASMKSAKPELAAIFAEPETATVVVQFESETHEKERIELYQSKRGNKIRGWLRYPRLFDGRKQRVDLNWIQWKRAPPKLCGCIEQSWGHKCEVGISCGRGSSVKVWGVGSAAGDAPMKKS